MVNAIKELLISYGDNGGWYNPKKLLPYFDDTMLMFIIGERRIGKTDLMLRLACDLWKKYGKKTMWIRNKAVELNDPAFFGAFLNDAWKHGWAPTSWECRPDGVYDTEIDERIILFQSISTFSNRRGGAHPDVEMMVLDEIMPEDRRYPPKCATGLMSLTKTVFSGNTNARCFALSNFVSIANPYFATFQVYPEAKKDITYYEEKRILIEVCKGYHKAIEKDNPWNSVYVAGKYQDYASEEEDPLLNLIRKVPKGAKECNFKIIREGVWYKPYLHKGLLYWDIYNNRNGSSRDLQWSATLQECTDDIHLLPAKVKKEFKDGVNRMRFKSPNVLYAVLSLLFEQV